MPFLAPLKALEMFFLLCFYDGIFLIPTCKMNYINMQVHNVDMQHNLCSWAYNLFMSLCNITMLTCNKDKLHVNIVMLHIDIGKFSDVCLHYYDAG